MSRMIAVIAAVSISIASMTSAPDARAQDGGWFVSFERQSISQIPRGETSRYVSIGTVETDGFSELRISIGGEFKDSIPKTGTIGAILVPDRQPFPYLLESEGQVLFAIEVQASIGPSSGPLVFSEPVTAKVAFPAYRVYLYNDSNSVANVSVFVYRARY